jgi:MFS family permease
MIAELLRLNRDQRAACIAALLGWSLDAFDFFLLIFVLGPIAKEFHTQVKDVGFAVTLTLMLRPAGALFFGWLAERFGRRPILMLDIVLYSLLELASAFAPSLTGSVPRWRWKPFPPKAAASFPASCRKATPSVTCSPPSSTGSFSPSSAGAACS